MKAFRKQSLEWLEPLRMASLTIEDLMDFMREPKNVFDGIPLHRVCRDDDCGIEEVHRRHSASTRYRRRPVERQPASSTVPCPDCMRVGHLDGEICALCMGRGIVPRILLRMMERR
jgi:hypothetical protein